MNGRGTSLKKVNLVEETFLQQKDTKIIQKDGYVAIVKEKQKDPLNLPQYKEKRIPRGKTCSPPPKLCSPIKNLSKNDLDSWKVPPCISNWKNSKGFIIPLEMRLAADGRNLKQFKISSNFLDFNSALNAAEKQARAEIEERNRQSHASTLQNLKNLERSQASELDLVKAEKAKLSSINIFLPKSTNQTAESGYKLNNETHLDKHKEASFSEENIEIDSELQQRNILRHIIKKKVERDQRKDRMSKKRKLITEEFEKHSYKSLPFGGCCIELEKNSFLQKEKAHNISYEEDDPIFDKPLINSKKAQNIYIGRDQLEDELSEVTSSKQLMPHKARVLGGSKLEFIQEQ